MTNSTTIITILRTMRNLAKCLKEKYETGKVSIYINLDKDTIEIITDLNKEEK